MKTYQYTGINNQGERVRAEIHAENEQDLETRLARQNIDLIDFSEKKASFLANRQKVTSKDLLTLTLQMHQLISAGVPLLETLNDLQESIDNARLRNILNNIYENMLGGKTFSEALSDFSDVFDEVYRGLVKVGEQTGQLEKILAELTSMLKWQDELSAKAKKIMIYPAIVGMVVGGVTIFMMTVVVPQIVGFVKDMGGELPLQTQALLATSEFIINDWYWLIIVPGAFVMTYKYLRKINPNFVLASDKFFLHLKPFGPIFFRIKLARMANTMAVMYAAGVGLRDILETTGRIVSNAYLQQQIQGIYSQIEQGQSLYSAFEQTQTFPKLFNKLIKVGENSGKLDEALRNLSYIYDREAKEAIDKIEPAIEPAITLFMAIIIGWVLMSVLGPIWDSLGKMT